MEFRFPELVRIIASAGTIIACGALGSTLTGAEPSPASDDASHPVVDPASDPPPQVVQSDPAELDPPIMLDPVVVSASRFEESMLLAPASISVVSSGKLAREGGPSVVSTFRTVPGVDFQQAGVNRFLIAVRGFNNAFSSNTYTMVDHREAFNPALGLVAYSGLPIDALDIDRIEVVRGPGSALYGPGADQGVIQFITKDPFAYPGTPLAVGIQYLDGGCGRKPAAR